MCGFLVFFPTGNKKLFNKEKFKSAAKLIDHRGRSEFKELYTSEINFAFHRLSIRDLSPKGSQPMYSHNKRFIMVFNGEIYNSSELKKLLTIKLKGTSDSEVLINLYQKFGNKFLKLVKGMFSIIIYDKYKKECFVARDRFGIKPLYYFKNKDFLICSSEIKPLLHYLKINSFNTVKFGELFFRQNLDGGNKTFFESIYSFLPSNYYLISKRYFKKFQYWEIEDSSKELSFSETTKKFKYLMKKSIKMHSISDREISILLSGGFDSTTILNLYSQINNKLPETFTYDFTSNKFSELKKSQEIAKQLGVKNYSVIVNHSYVIDNFEKIIDELESPFTSIRLFGLRSVFELMQSKGKKVVFEGGGGDEILGGYRYNYINNILDKHFDNKKNNLMSNLNSEAKNINDFYDIIRTILFQNNSSKDCNIFFDKDFFSEDFYNQYSKLQNYEMSGNKKLNFTQKSQLLDINEVNLPRSLKYMDRLAMNQNIENRVPLLDEDLAKFCFNLKNKYKFKGNQSRFILKKSYEKNNLNKFITKSKKAITDPQSLWMKTYLKDYIMDEFSSTDTKNLGIFDYKKLLINFELFLKNKYKSNNSFLFFLVFTSLIFYKRFKKI